jgi:predicted TIM-barrel enzyme
LTIPPNSSVAYGIGTQINIAQLGAGQVTITAGAGVTLNSSGTKLKLKDQYAVATCVKTDTNTWFVVGNLSA